MSTLVIHLILINLFLWSKLKIINISENLKVMGTS